MPQCLRFDNGKPWGNPALRVPTSLTLWLVGLGIKVIFGRPRQSTDNAVVERCHGVLAAWVEPSTCADYADLAQRLAHSIHLQREVYPALQGCARLQAHPSLHVPRQPYRSEDDPLLWQRERVLAYLAPFTLARRVEKNGRITLLTHAYSLGAALRGQTISAQLDPLTAHWLLKDRDGLLLKAFPAAQLSYDIIASMRLTYQDFKAKPNVVSRGV